MSDPITEDELHTNCKFCKRPLTGLLSMMLGMGPTCAEKNGIVRVAPDDPNQLVFKGIKRRTNQAKVNRRG